MFISFASDLLSLLTLHLFVFYLMATSIFSWHLSMLGALFNIFRGPSLLPVPQSAADPRLQGKSSTSSETASNPQRTTSTSSSSERSSSRSPRSSSRPCWRTTSLLPPCVSSLFLLLSVADRAQSRLSVIVGHAAMETALAFMNHFPLFAVTLRCKDPARLPGALG